MAGGYAGTGPRLRLRVITRIRGTVESAAGNAVTLSLGDGSIAREVLVPAFDVPRLERLIGEPTTLHTLEYLESHNQGASFVPRLVGFRSPEDRRFFELFTTVKGIGNRKALRAMAKPPTEIAGAIAGKNPRALAELPEIGKRLAETIIAELSGKVDAYLSGEERADLDAAAELKPGSEAGVMHDLIAAMVSLGETRSDAERLASLAIRQARRDGSAPERVEDLLPLALSGRGR